MLGLLRSWARRRARNRPLTSAQCAILAAELPFVTTMGRDDAARFYAHIQMFLAEKRFEGVDITVTDEMRLVIAGCAARLSRNVDFSIYDGLGTVVIYADRIFVPRVTTTILGGGLAVVDHGEMEVLGEQHRLGQVVLSWSAVKAGLADPHDGHDVALHELAHAIDAADGDAKNGTPPLDRARSRVWARVFSKHFLALQAGKDRGLLNAHGGTNEAEFFAVAVEAFFEKPSAMLAVAPDLYDALRHFFNVDPAHERSHRAQ